MNIDVEEIRRRAAIEAGRSAIEEHFGIPKLSAVDAILLQKSVAAISTDNELLKVAVAIRPGDPLAAYKELGGTYGEVKEAVSFDAVRKVVKGTKATPERLEEFSKKMERAADRVAYSGNHVLSKKMYGAAGAASNRVNDHISEEATKKWGGGPPVKRGT